ncbi:DUF4259 domain-containing protein [Streptomyces sp. NBC_00024]|uniref:DUF4259 domain-containing protein n=1 Tax=Streptomyces sp. NBC_00024 TaxID=2903612 RepID=UPI003251EA22
MPDARIPAQPGREIPVGTWGTWGTDPFGNATAADFADALDATGPEGREALIRGVLTRTVDATGHLGEADEAVAAALLAAQYPGGEPAETPYGPASDRVDPDDPDDSKQWPAMLNRLRTVLAPPPSSLAGEAARSRS